MLNESPKSVQKVDPFEEIQRLEELLYGLSGLLDRDRPSDTAIEAAKLMVTEACQSANDIHIVLAEIEDEKLTAEQARRAHEHAQAKIHAASVGVAK